MADHGRRPKARAKQASDGNGASLFLNITAMVLVVIAFLLHNWPAHTEGVSVAQNNTARAAQQSVTPPASAPAANP